jgi:hypothetical protein
MLRPSVTGGTIRMPYPGETGWYGCCVKNRHESLARCVPIHVLPPRRSSFMAHVIFYEKPGCGGNARQKALLVAAGHTLDVRSLLAWPWTPDALLAFLRPLPVAQWFNQSTARNRSGAVRWKAAQRRSGEKPGTSRCFLTPHPR